MPLVLPAYDVEACVCNAVSCLLYVHMDGRGLFEVFLVPFPMGPCCFTYVPLIAGYVFAFETLDDPSVLVLRVLVLGFHKDLFDCCVALEVYLYTILTTDVLETFHYSFCVRYDYLSYCRFVTLSWCSCACASIAVCLCLVVIVAHVQVWLFLVVVGVAVCTLLIVVALILPVAI